jgi:hypothetical protein
MADGAELLYHATAEKNPGLAADAAKDYIADQGKAMLHATAGAALSGNDVTADFNLKEHIMSQISGE